MTPFKIKVIQKSHTVSPRTLIFKLQQEVLKLSDIFMSWSSPKTDLETKFISGNLSANNMKKKRI